MIRALIRRPPAPVRQPLAFVRPQGPYQPVYQPAPMQPVYRPAPAPTRQLGNVPAASPHACGVKLSLSAQELEALVRGGPGTYVQIVGTNQCGQVVQVLVQKTATAGGVGHAPLVEEVEEADYPEEP